MADTTLKMVLLGEDRSASRALRGVGDEAERAGKRAKASGAMFKGALGADIVSNGAAAIASFGMDSVKQFAAVEDATGAAAVIFGTSMGQITAQAETAASTLGLSKQQVLEAAGTFGTLGKAAGLSGDDLAGFSTKMTGLAGDLASFKGTSPEEAVQAIGAALRGETEPIRRYGVMLDDASMRQEALRMGLIKTTKDALTPQQKSLAAQSLILKQTKDAQGDYARTADSTSNTLKTQQAQFENLQSTLGEQLAPALVSIARVGMQVIDWISQNVSWLGPLAAGIGITTAAMLALNVAMSANPIGLVVIAIGALVGALIYAYQNSEAFRNIVNGAFQAIGKVARWLWNNALAPMIRGMITGFANVVDGIAWMLEALGNVPGFEWAKGAASNLRGLAKDARTLAGNIKDIPDADPQIKAKDEATAKIKAIDTEIKRLKGKVVEAKAKGDDKEVRNLQNKINALKNKKVSINANVYRSGISTITVRTTGMGTIRVRAVARGGILGARRFAAGGVEDHTARIYGPGDGIRIFNEPETHGESYIPLADDWRRPRAQAILRETASRIGMRAFSAGGMTGPAGAGASIYAPITVSGDTDPLAAARRIEAHLSKLWESKGRRPLAFQRG